MTSKSMIPADRQQLRSSATAARSPAGTYQEDRFMPGVQTALTGVALARVPDAERLILSRKIAMRGRGIQTAPTVRTVQDTDSSVAAEQKPDTAGGSVGSSPRIHAIASSSCSSSGHSTRPASLATKSRAVARTLTASGQTNIARRQHTVASSSTSSRESFSSAREQPEEPITMQLDVLGEPDPSVFTPFRSARLNQLTRRSKGRLTSSQALTTLSPNMEIAVRSMGHLSGLTPDAQRWADRHAKSIETALVPYRHILPELATPVRVDYLHYPLDFEISSKGSSEGRVISIASDYGSGTSNHSSTEANRRPPLATSLQRREVHCRSISLATHAARAATLSAQNKGSSKSHENSHRHARIAATRATQASARRRQKAAQVHAEGNTQSDKAARAAAKYVWRQ